MAELDPFPRFAIPSPGVATFVFDSLVELHAALDRVYRLAVSLPEVPLSRFQSAIRDLPQSTEAERLVVQRIGQDIFRDALVSYWGGRCPLTGIDDCALLRASHIVPWAECGDDQRLDVHNGLLLSALWDAALTGDWSASVTTVCRWSVLTSALLPRLPWLSMPSTPSPASVTPIERTWRPTARYGF